MIRRATHDDIDEIVRLGADFLAICPYSWVPLDAEAFAVFVGGLIEGGAVFLSEDGMIGGCLSPFFFNPSVLIGAELFWFARSEGRELRKAFEEWATDRGAACITCAGLANDREPAIRRIYTAAGYVPAEVAFVKRIAA